MSLAVSAVLVTALPKFVFRFRAESFFIEDTLMGVFVFHCHLAKCRTSLNNKQTLNTQSMLSVENRLHPPISQDYFLSKLESWYVVSCESCRFTESPPILIFM
jgi:hypothetical protein